MIRPGFLDGESRQDLMELTRDGSAAHRFTLPPGDLRCINDAEKRCGRRFASNAPRHTAHGRGRVKPVSRA